MGSSFLVESRSGVPVCIGSKEVRRIKTTYWRATMKRFPRTATLALVMAAFGLAACHGDDDGDNNGSGSQNNALPNFISGGVRTQTYDGTTDDLLTAGLGKDGLASATPPAISNPAAPSATDLRRLAIYSNYRALVDMSANGG